MPHPLRSSCNQSASQLSRIDGGFDGGKKTAKKSIVLAPAGHLKGLNSGFEIQIVPYFIECHLFWNALEDLAHAEKDRFLPKLSDE
ncbi:hypothetical protein SAMN05421772_10372 [Paracoccus saliphilus]|uniref:Uncharacterized protein n=1 Tax=Paracoccus saliphilus TaxID=405559 RepID=A0AA46A4U2_9RHOB|nr:hypothetical protein SAMN05421772_10372 [Paracoccus saliphilus]